MVRKQGLMTLNEGKDERKRRRKVEDTWHKMDYIARISPPALADPFKRALRKLTETQDLREQEQIITEAVKEGWSKIKPAMMQLHAAFDEKVGETTGMTLEDYLWLRDFEKEEQ